MGSIIDEKLCMVACRGRHMASNDIRTIVGPIGHAFAIREVIDRCGHHQTIISLALYGQDCLSAYITRIRSRQYMFYKRAYLTGASRISRARLDWKCKRAYLAGDSQLGLLRLKDL